MSDWIEKKRARVSRSRSTWKNFTPVPSFLVKPLVYDCGLKPDLSFAHILFNETFIITFLKSLIDFLLLFQRITSTTGPFSKLARAITILLTHLC